MYSANRPTAAAVDDENSDEILFDPVPDDEDFLYAGGVAAAGIGWPVERTTVTVVTREKLSDGDTTATTTKGAASGGDGTGRPRDDGAALFDPLPADGFRLNGGANQQGDAAAADSDGGWPPDLLGCGGTSQVIAASAGENKPDVNDQGWWTTDTAASKSATKEEAEKNENETRGRNTAAAAIVRGQHRTLPSGRRGKHQPEESDDSPAKNEGGRDWRTPTAASPPSRRPRRTPLEKQREQQHARVRHGGAERVVNGDGGGDSWAIGSLFPSARRGRSPTSIVDLA